VDFEIAQHVIMILCNNIEIWPAGINLNLIPGGGGKPQRILTRKNWKQFGQ